MIAKAASASRHTVGDPMADTASHAPKPRPSRRSDRLVLSLEELPGNLYRGNSEGARRALAGAPLALDYQEVHAGENLE